MNAFLLFLFLFWTGPLSDVPNYFPTYTSAREASKASQKDLLVFFTKTECANCATAWKAFEKDGNSTSQYISTQMDAEDFDGGVMFNAFEFQTVPSWVILSPEGKVKEKWEGGWKDASGNPTVFAQTEMKKNEVPPTATKKVDSKSEPVTPTNSTSSNTKTSVTSTQTESISKPKVTETSAPKSDATSTSFVIQSGYFGSESNAQKQVGDLKTKGFNQYSIKSTVQNGSTFYRVISKSFSSEVEANKEIQSLSVSGIKGTVKKASEL